MNNTVYYDPTFSDDERRQRLFDGQLMVYSPRSEHLSVHRICSYDDQGCLRSP